MNPAMAAPILIILDLHHSPHLFSEAFGAYQPLSVWLEIETGASNRYAAVASGRSTPEIELNRIRRSCSHVDPRFLKRMGLDLMALHCSGAEITGEREWSPFIHHMYTVAEQQFASAVSLVLNTGSIDEALPLFYAHATSYQAWQRAREAAIEEQWLTMHARSPLVPMLFCIGEAHERFTRRFAAMLGSRPVRIVKHSGRRRLLTADLLDVDLEAAASSSDALSSLLARQWFEELIVEMFDVTHYSNRFAVVIGNVLSRISLADIRAFATSLASLLPQYLERLSDSELSCVAESGRLRNLMGQIAVNWATINKKIRGSERRYFSHVVEKHTENDGPVGPA